jgi:MFS family permease
MPASAAHRYLHARNITARYRAAKSSLRTPESSQSRRGLDWMNFFIADVQTGFGTFVAFYLAHLGWSQGSVGLVLTIGSLVGVLGQIPGGALADAVNWKRGLSALGIAMIGSSALILALSSSFVAVLCAEVLHGATGGIITTAIGAISLGLVGPRAMSLRTGRNYRFAAAGHAATAALMGLAGTYFSDSAIFITAALLCIPALIALSYIRPDEIDYRRARNLATGDQAGKAAHVFDLVKNHKLMLFAAALVLFQLADASMLPLMGEHLATKAPMDSSLWMAGLIIVPQIVVAIFAPWVGYHSERKGRRPLLLIGFALEPVRAALLAFTSDYSFLLVAQLLDGVSGAIIGVLSVIVITDLTSGTGRFNLARGTIGAMTGIAASLSTVVTGFFFQGFGAVSGFILIAVIAGAATVLLWVFLSETKPASYLD